MKNSNEKLFEIESIEKIREQQIVTEMGSIFSVISNSMVIPLFLIFWIADLIYIPELKWHTLALRLTVIPLVFFGKYVLSKPRSYTYLQVTMSLYAFCCASVLNAIIFLIDNPQTGYYAGLNLVAIGTLSFVPFRLRFLFLCAIAIYLPYYLVVLNQAKEASDFSQVAIHSFFILGTLSISGIIHYFNENLRRQDLRSRIGLNQEISEREKIISIKTTEATKLKQLSTQFSPQVVEAIHKGDISLEQNASIKKICVVFIDIVGSTEKVNSLSPENFQKAIEMFLNLSIESFLKFDLTIDKFQGDGILAFSNSPVEHSDFVDRVCLAIIEIRNKIEKSRVQLENIWNGPFFIRTGVAVGTANVGFFGDRKNFSTFTAVGRPMALAARICASANPNQVLVDRESAFALPKDRFQIASAGMKSFKGFLNEEIECFELLMKSNQFQISEQTVCPDHPEAPLCINLEENKLQCRLCSFEVLNTKITDYNLDEKFLIESGLIKKVD